MKKIFRIIVDKLYYISLIILILTLVPIGVILYKIFLELGHVECLKYLLIFFISWISLMYCFNSTSRKPIDYWSIFDILVFSLCFLSVILSVQLFPDISGVHLWLIILSVLLLLLIASLVINLFIYNKFLFIVFCASLIYGIINDDMYNVLLALITYIMGSLDIDDIKKHFKLDIFNEEKFIKDKYLTMLAISSTALANVIGEPILKFIFKNINLCFYGYHFNDIIYRGGFRVIFSSITFMVLLSIYKMNINKIVKRYTDSDNSGDIEENLSENEDLDKHNDKLDQMPERKDLNIKDDFVKKDRKKTTVFIIAFAMVLGIVGKLFSEREKKEND